MTETTITEVVAPKQTRAFSKLVPGDFFVYGDRLHRKTMRIEEHDGPTINAMIMETGAMCVFNETTPVEPVPEVQINFAR